MKILLKIASTYLAIYSVVNHYKVNKISHLRPAALRRKRVAQQDSPEAISCDQATISPLEL